MRRGEGEAREGRGEPRWGVVRRGEVRREAWAEVRREVALHRSGFGTCEVRSRREARRETRRRERERREWRREARREVR